MMSKDIVIHKFHYKVPIEMGFRMRLLHGLLSKPFPIAYIIHFAETSFAEGELIIWT